MFNIVLIPVAMSTVALAFAVYTHFTNKNKFQKGR